jgi:hypothetical protein
MKRTQFKPIDRGALSSLPIKKKSSSVVRKGKENPASKFQAISKLIVNKLDDILSQHNGKDLVIPYEDMTSTSNLLSNIDISSNAMTDLSTSELRLMELNTNMSGRLVKESKPQIKKLKSDTLPKLNSKPNNQKKTSKVTKNKKNTFMTDVEVEQIKKSEYEGSNKSNINKPSKFMEEENKKVEEIIKNINSIDDVFNDELNSHDVNDRLRRDAEDFKNLIADIDEYKQSIKDEFDELQYLIKFADDTRGRVSRFKSGVNNVFQKAGMKPKTITNDSFENEEKDDLSDRRNDSGDDDISTVYNKLKNMSKIKDSLYNIHDGMIDYYQKFNNKVGQIKK